MFCKVILLFLALYIELLLCMQADPWPCQMKARKVSSHLNHPSWSLSPRSWSPQEPGVNIKHCLVNEDQMESQGFSLPSRGLSQLAQPGEN